MSTDMTIFIGILTALISVAGIIVWDILRDRSQRKATLQEGYRWLLQELLDNNDWIILNQAGPDSKDKADAKTRLESRGLLPGMSTVSVSALRYVITSAGLTHMLSLQNYRTLVTLEDTLSILRDDLKDSHSFPMVSAGYQNYIKPKLKSGMDLALRQIEDARKMVDGQFS